MPRWKSVTKWGIELWLMEASTWRKDRKNDGEESGLWSVTAESSVEIFGHLDAHGLKYDLDVGELQLKVWSEEECIQRMVLRDAWQRWGQWIWRRQWIFPLGYGSLVEDGKKALDHNVWVWMRNALKVGSVVGWTTASKHSTWNNRNLWMGESPRLELY